MREALQPGHIALETQLDGLFVGLPCHTVVVAGGGYECLRLQIGRGSIGTFVGGREDGVEVAIAQPLEVQIAEGVAKGTVNGTEDVVLVGALQGDSAVVGDGKDQFGDALVDLVGIDLLADVIVEDRGGRHQPQLHSHVERARVAHILTHRHGDGAAVGAQRALDPGIVEGIEVAHGILHVDRAVGSEDHAHRTLLLAGSDDSRLVGVLVAALSAAVVDTQRALWLLLNDSKIVGDFQLCAGSHGDEP